MKIKKLVWKEERDYEDVTDSEGEIYFVATPLFKIEYVIRILVDYRCKWYVLYDSYSHAIIHQRFRLLERAMEHAQKNFEELIMSVFEEGSNGD